MAFVDLAKKLKSQYQIAEKSGQIEFIETSQEELEVDGIEFDLRVVESIRKKPTAEESKINPFLEPHSDLIVMEEVVKEEEDDDGESFYVLLNKYPVVSRHFLLVTKTYESQNTALTPTQLLATYQILKTMQKKEKCIAFYNSGNHSGASQPHKHIQFLPLNANPPFDEFIEAHKPQNLKAGFQLPLEYSNFTIMIATPPSSAAQLAGYLGNLFMTLLDLMIDHLRRLSLISGSEVTPIRLSQLSYNLIMTTTYMHLVPRTRERFESGETSISLNALAFAGQLLFKNQNDLEELKKFGVFEALTSVAYPAVANGEAELEEDSANPVALGEF